MAGQDLERRASAGGLDTRAAKRSNVVFRDCRITFRNFQGKEGQYNNEGDRNFALLIDDSRVADQMLKDGWNVKFLKAREEGDVAQPYLPVAVSYKFRPPRTELITSQGRTPLYEDMIGMFDWVEIEKVDLVINPSEWTVGQKSGVKAYLKSMFLTMAEDELELEYASMPEVKLESAQKIVEFDAIPTDEFELDDIIDAEIVED